MQIHELNTFVGAPSATDYLAIDDGSETNKVPATALGVSTQMTQAEAEAGTVTDPRVISPSVFKSSMIDVVYPVGSYFETSDADFDPSTEWGGTWTLVSSKDAYVVDEGTSGDWTYRKWSDGTSECWLNHTEPTAQAFNSTGNVFYRVIEGLNFPSGTFISQPTVVATVDSGSISSCMTANVSYRTCSVAVMSSTNTARAVSIRLYAKGKWSNTSETYYRWHRTA